MPQMFRGTEKNKIQWCTGKFATGERRFSVKQYDHQPSPVQSTPSTTSTCSGDSPIASGEANVGDAISEEPSEKKRKRGRPSNFSPDMWALAKLTGLKSRRGQLGFIKKSYAMCALHEEGEADRKRFQWLVDRDALDAGQPDSVSWPRPKLLEVLGSVYLWPDIRDMADVLCRERPTEAEGAEMIRDWKKTWVPEYGWFAMQEAEERESPSEEHSPTGDCGTDATVIRVPNDTAAEETIEPAAVEAA